MDSQDEVNTREWADPRNWRGWFCIYSSKADDRIWVPKRNPRMGLTLNFAHRGAWWSLLGLSIVPLGFVLLFVLLWLDRTV
jgi:uncharacterized membrane protein